MVSCQAKRCTPMAVLRITPVHLSPVLAFACSLSYFFICPVACLCLDVFCLAGWCAVLLACVLTLVLYYQPLLCARNARLVLRSVYIFGWTPLIKEVHAVVELDRSFISVCLCACLYTCGFSLSFFLSLFLCMCVCMFMCVLLCTLGVRGEK